MVNHQSQGSGTIDRTVATDLLNSAFDVVWMREDKVPQNLGQLFDKEMLDSGLNFKISNVGSEMPLPQINDDLAPLPYDTPPQGFDKNIVLKGYRLGVRVTDTMLKADRFDRVVQMATGLVKASRRRDEYAYASIINNAHTGTSGADGVCLSSATHPAEQAGAANWSNYSSGALSGANLQATRLVMRKITNARGYPMDIVPTAVVIAEDLEQEMLELIKSPQRAEDSLNGITVLISGLKILVSPYLSSTVMYTMVGNLTGRSKGLHDITLIDWNIKDNAPANADIVIDKRIKAVKMIDFTATRNLVVSTGA